MERTAPLVGLIPAYQSVGFEDFDNSDAANNGFYVCRELSVMMVVVVVMGVCCCCWWWLLLLLR